ncbi:hypothetical protein DM01DRAFT_1128255 [Hesseltinella vesiculosa]|uniref:Uncharacterized protein n=1 Tax=Hesseltinella vesiculosa TaxID=101127 RepID=A0A1X2GUQ4_9FUNG|nr:hypothetical protein DM01DRAFT_1128255 [Hesseltinella vesiculosa]
MSPVRRKPRPPPSARPQSMMVPPPNNVDLSEVPRPFVKERRPSVTSISSTTSSIQSNMSTATASNKKSFSKRLRHVFSMNNMRASSSTKSNASASSSTSDVSSIQTMPSLEDDDPQASPRPSLRRRSLASLTSLFKSSTSSLSLASPTSRRPSVQSNLNDSTLDASDVNTPEQVSPATPTSPPAPLTDEKGRPVLRVDTSRAVRNGSAKTIPSAVTATASPSTVPLDTPSSATRSPADPASGLPRSTHDLPSPSPSSSSTSSITSPSLLHAFDDDEELAKIIDQQAASQQPRFLGNHYGMPMTHGSPRLKPTASSSSSSLVHDPSGRRRLQFCPKVQVHETYSAMDYDRRCDTNVTCQKLTPNLAMKIKQELNEYKLTDMEVHVDSRQYTHFFL